MNLSALAGIAIGGWYLWYFIASTRKVIQDRREGRINTFGHPVLDQALLLISAVVIVVAVVGVGLWFGEWAWWNKVLFVALVIACTLMCNWLLRKLSSKRR